MNRRDFFKFAAAAVVASRLPLPAAAAPPSCEWITIDAVRRARDALFDNAVNGDLGYYVAVLHPSWMAQIESELTPREAWKLAYRKARIDLKDMARSIALTGSFGTVSGFRFIESATLP